MYIVTRRMGSSRTSKPIRVTIVPNTAGQGGFPFLSFEKEDGTILSLHPETEQDMKALLSAVHTCHHNFNPGVVIPYQRLRRKSP